MTTPIDFEKEFDRIKDIDSHSTCSLVLAVELCQSIAARVERETIERCRLEQSHSSTWYEPKLLYSTAPSDAAKGAK